jgi:hypothetical protein
MNRPPPLVAIAMTLAALSLALTLGPAACSIDARSDQYRCTGTGDCSGGRVCQGGWCVVSAGGDPGDDGTDDDGTTDDGTADGDGGGGATSDAALPARDAGGEPDATGCPAACTRCDQDTCAIDCLEDGSCADPVVCPPGLACTVICDGRNSCESGVDCSAADSCDVRCTSREACAGPIECGPGACSVGCTARDSCAGGIDCSDSCTCATNCSGPFACREAPSCPFLGFGCTDGTDCFSSETACNRCE